MNPKINNSRPSNNATMNAQNISTTQHRFTKTCETFCAKLRKNEPRIFENFARLIIGYKQSNKNPIQTLERIVKEFEGQQSIIVDLNRLLHTEAQVPLRSDEVKKAEFQEQFQQFLQLIQEEKPDKFNDLIKVVNQVNHSSKGQQEVDSEIALVLREWNTKQLLKDCPGLYEELDKVLKPYDGPNSNRNYSSGNGGYINDNCGNVGGGGYGHHGAGNRSVATGSLGAGSQSHAQGKKNVSINRGNNHNHHSNNHAHGGNDFGPSGGISGKGGHHNGHNHHGGGIGYHHGHNTNSHGGNYNSINPAHPNFNQNSMGGMNEDEFRDQTNILGTNANLLNFGPGANKSESTYFDLLIQNLTPAVYTEILKIIHLYSECIITCNQFLELITPVFRKYLKEDYLEFIRNMVVSRESDRRKTTKLFKPLNDIDFSKAERTTHSYVSMPLAYPKQCSQTTILTQSVLNTEVVSVPHGSEHQSFHIMRKNNYEDALFKSEDEKYEFDLAIMTHQQCLNLMQKVIDLGTDENPKKNELVDKILDLQVVQTLYKAGSAQSTRIVEFLRSDPNTAKVIIHSVKQKLEEFVTTEEQNAKKMWREIADQNFHQSLDHRSFYFKKNDKRFTSAARYDKEPAFRYQLLTNTALSENDNQEEFEQDVSKFFQIMNSFDGLTQMERCNHLEEEKKNNLIDDYKKVKLKQNLPFFVLAFSNQEIASDAYSFLIYFVQYYGANQAEREKIKKIIHTVLKGIFDSNFQVFDPSDQNLKEAKLLRELRRIESLIFDYSHIASINQQQFKEEENNNPQNQVPENGAAGGQIDIQTEEGGMDLQNNGAINNKKAGAIIQKNNNSEVKLEVKTEIKQQEEEVGGIEIQKIGEPKPIQQKKEEMDQEEEEKSITQSVEENEEQEEEEEDQNNKEQSQDGQEAPAVKGKGKKNEKLKQTKKNAQKDAPDQDEDDNDQEENQQQDDQEEDQNSLFGFDINLLQEMSYLVNEKQSSEIPLLPPEGSDSIILFSSKHLYIFLRLFYTLYERLCKAKEISSFYESHGQTTLLSQAVKEKLSAERYEIFKNVMLNLLKTKGDVSQYEDYLRCIFGKQAYLLFTIDKLLTSTCKSLQAFAADEVAKQLLNQFISPTDLKFDDHGELEEIKYIRSVHIARTLWNAGAGNAAIDKQKMDKSLFRINYNQENCILYFNYFEIPEKHWDKNQLKDFNHYLHNFVLSQPTLSSSLSTAESHQEPVNQTQNSNGVLFMRKNIMKFTQNRELKIQRLQSVFQLNNIQYTSFPNSLLLHSFKIDCQDYMLHSPIKQVYSSQSERIKALYLNKVQQIKIEALKINQFNQWLQEQINK